MAADPAPAPDAEIIAVLNAVYRLILTDFEAFHRQEHRFKTKYRYKKLVKRYDKLVHCGRCWRRKVLDRIERLGGDADSTIGPVQVYDDIGEAYKDTLARLRDLFAAARAGIEVAESKDDCVTYEVFEHIAGDADRKIAKFEAHVRQIQDMGDNYLLTVV